MAAGDVIPPQFDSMIAKVIAWGRDRGEARARLSRALRQTSVVIRGGTTSKGFLLDLPSRPEFVRGEIDTTWLDTMMAGGYAPPLRVDVALLATAYEAYEAHARRQQDRLFTCVPRRPAGSPRCSPTSTRRWTVEPSCCGSSHPQIKRRAWSPSRASGPT